MQCVNEIISYTTDTDNYQMMLRYYENTPEEIRDVALNELMKFELGDASADQVLQTIQDKADDVLWKITADGQIWGDGKYFPISCIFSKWEDRFMTAAKKKKKYYWRDYLYIVPAVVMIGVFFISSIFYTLHLSLF